MREERNIIQHLITVILIILLLVFLNLIVSELFIRIDLTEKHQFTISRSTKRVLRELEEPLTINAYFSKKFPSHLLRMKRDVRDILDSFKSFSKNKVDVKFFESDDSEETKNELSSKGIQEVRVNIFTRDKAESVNVFMGIVLDYEDRRETIPVISGTENLEYELVSSILRLTRPDRKTIGFTTGHSEADLEQDCSIFSKEIRKQFTIRNVDTKKDQIPQDVEILFINGPLEKFEEIEKFYIDQFLMRGGKLVVLLDKVKLSDRYLMGFKNETGLDDLLKSYNINIGYNLVLDISNVITPFNTQSGMIIVKYPFFVKAISKYINQEHAITKQIETLVIPWVSSIEITPDEKIEVVELVKSTEYAWLQEESFNLSPQQTPVLTEDMNKQYLLCALINGKFKSHYKTPPEELKKEDEEIELDEFALIKESAETQIFVVGNSRFLNDNFVNNSPSNLIMILNMLDILSYGDELASIRTRSVVDRPIKDVSAKTKTIVIVLNTVLVPILLIGFGLFRFSLYRKKRLAYREELKKDSLTFLQGKE